MPSRATRCRLRAHRKTWRGLTSPSRQASPPNHPAHGGRSRGRGRIRSLVGWIGLAACGIGWWFGLAPRAIGGPATFVIVDGQSMEPMLHTGDLVIARTSPTYQVGDLAVFQHRSGHVIHRIVGGDAAGWITQGDNKPAPDPWTIPSANIDGQFWFSIPGVGGVVSWFVTHWWAYAALASIPIVLSFIPLHRRHIAPALRIALRRAAREPRILPSAREEALMFGILCGTTLLSGGVLALLVSMRPDTPTPWLLAGGVTLVLLCAVIFEAYRLFDGAGVAEPEKSLRALSGRLYRVPERPTVRRIEPLANVKALRDIAEGERLPVLHYVSEDGVHEFFVLTARRGTFGVRVDPRVAARNDSFRPLRRASDRVARPT
ncbi:MAG TPA: signal peptidase I [Microbacteriaceae bacterium]|nr:signal peptidase I [Microbacteriaceae bacterium]